MSYLVKDFLGRKGRKGDLGMELEIEGIGLPLDTMGIWEAKADGTLGEGGVEYVTSSPVDVKEKRIFLSGLVTRLDQKKYKIKMPCTRGSFHVHSNFLYNTPKQYWTSATAYWLTENLLFNFCDTYRKGNAFCLRLSDAEGTLSNVYRDLKRDYPFQSIGTDNIRYSGQNLAATIKFGTIEYRGMSSTLDLDKLDTWTSELYNLNINANKTYRDPSHLMDSYLRNDAKEFLASIYGPGFVKQLTSTKGWRDDLEENASIVCELAYFHDWDEWEKKINASLDEGVRLPATPDRPETARPNRTTLNTFAVYDDILTPARG